MKRRVFYLLLVLTVSSFASAQKDPVMDFARRYYRSDPFNRTFGDFLAHVVNDPQLTNKQTRYRTDSTLFMFTATYTGFNPFGFKPQRIDVALVEQNVVMYEARPQGDTILLYTIVAYGDSTERGVADIKKEYERINRRSARVFYDAKSENLNNSRITGTASNYFVNYAQMAPASVEWIQGLVKQPILRLTLRIRSRGNETVLPMSLYDSQ